VTEEPVELNLLDRATVRRRARWVALAAVAVGLLVGGAVALFSVPIGVAVLIVLVAPVLLTAFGEARRNTTLRGTWLVARGLRTRSVDLAGAGDLGVLVTTMRGMRTVSLMAQPAGGGRAVSVGLAMYKPVARGTGAAELGVLELRRLADALATSGDAQALVLSELIVAQLRAEARGEVAERRPLHRVGELARDGQVAQRIDSQALGSFVADLD
jgi:hypothetical protein